MVCDEGLMPGSDWDQARGDMLADYVDDFKKPLIDIFHEKDEDKKVMCHS